MFIDIGNITWINILTFLFFIFMCLFFKFRGFKKIHDELDYYPSIISSLSVSAYTSSYFFVVFEVENTAISLNIALFFISFYLVNFLIAYASSFLIMETNIRTLIEKNRYLNEEIKELKSEKLQK